MGKPILRFTPLLPLAPILQEDAPSKRADSQAVPVILVSESREGRQATAARGDTRGANNVPTTTLEGDKISNPELARILWGNTTNFYGLAGPTVREESI